MIAALSQRTGRLSITTRGPGFTDVTGKVSAWLAEICADTGVMTVFIRHTSASLLIQENADPDVQHDLRAALDKLAPENVGYRHAMEGPDDMPAHIKAMVTNTTLTVPIENRELLLGIWQGIYVVEHRAKPHTRELALNFLGSFSD